MPLVSIQWQQRRLMVCRAVEHQKGWALLRLSALFLQLDQQGITGALPISSPRIIGGYLGKPQESAQQFATVDGRFADLGVH